MSFLYRLGQNPVKLFIVAQLFILLGFVWRDFPIFIFFAFAPLFALINHPTALRDSYLAFLVAVGTTIIFYYNMQQSMPQSSVLSWIIYFTILAGVFATYILLQQWTQNRLNKFGLIIFIMGMEYLLLKFMSAPVFLADLLAHKMDWTRWNIFTGYTGTTLWILITNLIFYQVFFREQKINWFFFSVGVLMIVLPIVYSLNLDHAALTKSDVVLFYSGSAEEDKPYSSYGELISRTGAWVSVLIIIFTLIKSKTKKVSR